LEIESKFAESCSPAATEASGQLARSAEVKKHCKYDGKIDQLNDQLSYKRYQFVPFAMEYLGKMGKERSQRFSLPHVMCVKELRWRNSTTAHENFESSDCPCT